MSSSSSLLLLKLFFFVLLSSGGGGGFFLTGAGVSASVLTLSSLLAVSLSFLFSCRSLLRLHDDGKKKERGKGGHREEKEGEKEKY